jgi:hypothetical protein
MQGIVRKRPSDEAGRGMNHVRESFGIFRLVCDTDLSLARQDVIDSDSLSSLVAMGDDGRQHARVWIIGTAIDNDGTGRFRVRMLGDWNVRM